MQVLETPLQILSIQKQQLPSIQHQLLQHIFLGERPKFFSFTENDIEISLVLDYRVSLYFDKSDVYRALAVESTDNDRILNITAPLAQHNISVFYHSTLQGDWILVRESKLQQVLEIIQEPVPHLKPKNIGLPVMLEHSLYMAAVPDHVLYDNTLQMIQQLFYNTQDRFFSFTMTEDGHSLIGCQKTLGLLGLHGSEELRCFQVDLRQEGIECCGVVHSMAERLRSVGVDLLYLSTYCTGNVLINLMDSKQAQDRLAQQL
ncbi:hypothetical protein EDD86DRAFT_214433 [Gorgonomyces haynaldii]|nr:hypothetical protein EDD86DRAFT_214433 [Gorgonomyces haynaldii]